MQNELGAFSEGTDMSSVHLIPTGLHWVCCSCVVVRFFRLVELGQDGNRLSLIPEQ